MDYFSKWKNLDCEIPKVDEVEREKERRAHTIKRLKILDVDSHSGNHCNKNGYDREIYEEIKNELSKDILEYLSDKWNLNNEEPIYPDADKLEMLQESISNPVRFRSLAQCPICKDYYIFDGDRETSTIYTKQCIYDGTIKTITWSNALIHMIDEHETEIDRGFVKILNETPLEFFMDSPPINKSVVKKSVIKNKVPGLTYKKYSNYREMMNDLLKNEPLIIKKPEYGLYALLKHGMDILDLIMEIEIGENGKGSICRYHSLISGLVLTPEQKICINSITLVIGGSNVRTITKKEIDETLSNPDQLPLIKFFDIPLPLDSLRYHNVDLIVDANSSIKILYGYYQALSGLYYKIANWAETILKGKDGDIIIKNGMGGILKP